MEEAEEAGWNIANKRNIFGLEMMKNASCSTFHLSYDVRGLKVDFTLYSYFKNKKMLRSQ
jgi:hypothetical protein